MRAVTATVLKAQCLAILDEVARTGEPVTITKRGRPVARIVPPVAAEAAALPPSFHRDPADRVIVSTARVWGATLLTSDTRLRPYMCAARCAHSIGWRIGG